MKAHKNIKLLIISVMFLLFSGYSYGQSFELTGYQTKGSAGKNAKLDCKAVTINKTVKIISIAGDNAGFWITKGGAAIAKYWKTNDPKAIGFSLKPGTYYIYPNLKRNQQKASVIVKLK